MAHDKIHSLSPFPRRYTLLLLAAASILSPCAMATGIFKYRADDGTTTYSDARPVDRVYKRLEPSCLIAYIDCELSRSDWSRIPLNRSAFREQIARVGSRHGVDPDLLRAVVHAESNFNRMAKSRAGAEGLMQLMPETQRTFGISDPYNVNQNLEAGTRLLKSLLLKYGHDITVAAAAYNAGEAAVQRYQGVPPYEETRNYVRRVTQLYARYREQ